MKMFIKLLFIIMFTSFTAFCSPKTITILSIDGGGIRGIIPAIVMQEIENRINQKTFPHKKHISFYFDIMSGNSTGGIIVLFLNVTNKKGEPLYRTNHLVEFYKHLGDKVFYRSFWQKISSGGGWYGDKYDPKAFEDLLHDYFANKTLYDTYTNVIIPAFDAAQQKMKFFSSYKAALCSNKNYYLKDIARSTSAAPTYFPPAIIKNVDKTNKHIMIDGGVASNNPTMCACVHAIDLYGKDINLIVVSLGTGSVTNSRKNLITEKNLNLRNMGILDWAPVIIPIMIDSDTDMVDYQMTRILGNNYFRLQIEMNQNDAALDNIDPDNIERLEEYGRQLIYNNDKILNQIVYLLTKNKQNIY